jgi:pimeloyl-ACP methyl ester carboxylesterase
VECLPDATVDIVPDAGHTLPEEVPDRVNDAVLRMVRSLAAGPASRSVAPGAATG